MLALLISYFFVLGGSHAAQWSSSSPSDGFAIFACVGDTITFRWENILASGQTIGDITWLYDGHSQEVVAMFSHNTFLPTPPFSHRVQQVGNAGISLTNAQIGDSGNYSVEVQVFQDSNSHVIMRRAVSVRVHDMLMTTDGALHASQSSEVVLDPNTGRFAIPLTCGEFTFNHNPPFQVEWLTPSGQVNSSDFQDHHFRLLLQSPVQGGNFTCRIPPQSAGEACLHGNGGHQGEATVYVDKWEARLTILEKENEVLRAHLQQPNAGNFTDQLNQINSTLSGLIETLKETARHQVAFHATVDGSLQKPPAGKPIVFSHVVYNQGNSYDSSTGYFTAQYPATYFFISTTGGFENNAYAVHYLMMDGTEIGRGYTYRNAIFANADFVPVHAAIHLQPGQRVWIQGDGSTYDVGALSMFSGFLVAHDP